MRNTCGKGAEAIVSLQARAAGTQGLSNSTRGRDGDMVQTATTNIQAGDNFLGNWKLPLSTCPCLHNSQITKITKIFIKQQVR